MRRKSEVILVEFLRADYFFLPILREISSTILGRKSARTLSTMLAISSDSDSDVCAPSGAFSAPAATAMAAASSGAAAADSSFEAGSAGEAGAGLVSPVSRMRRQLAQAAAVVAAISDSFFAISNMPPAASSLSAAAMSEETATEEIAVREITSEETGFAEADSAGTSLTKVGVVSGVAAVTAGASSWAATGAATGAGASLFTSSFFGAWISWGAGSGCFASGPSGLADSTL